jgi:transportin-3
MFATGTAEVSQPVEALLAVAAYPEDSVAFMSFEFWHRLSTVLTRAGSRATEGNGGGGGGNGGGSAEVSAAEATRRRQFFQPAFVRLIQVGGCFAAITHVSSPSIR